MKILVLIICLTRLQPLLSQDTLVFKDGIVRAVKIESVDEETGLISYQNKKENLTINRSDIIQYKWNNEWITHNALTGLYEKSASSPYKLYYSFFKSPSKYDYGRFSINASFSPTIETKNWSARNLFFADEGRFSIEPEFIVNPHFSLRIPIVVGLGQKAYSSGAHAEYLGSVHTGYGSSGNGTIYLYGDFFNYKGQEDHTNLPVVDSRNSPWNYDSMYNGHIKHLIFQIGISPKFFPFGQTQNAFYISPSINVGQADRYAVNYYTTFTPTSYTSVYTGELVETWEIKEEKAVVQGQSKFLFFRGEVLFGFNFNLTKSLNFAFESGLSTGILNQGEKDHVYTRIEGGDYNLAYSEIYDESEYLGLFRLHVINRFQLVYKFGGQRKETVKN